MHPGKIPKSVLERCVFSHLGKMDSAVALGPGVGRDASVIRIGQDALIVSTDPITGSKKDAGWLAVNVNANDIATFGVEPRWFLVSLLLPVGSTDQDVERVMSQMERAARELDVMIVGGHTEVTAEVEEPIITGFMMGVATGSKYVTSSGARPGDRIILTKTVGIEGTAILASDGQTFLRKHITEEELGQARELLKQISVVKEGVIGFKTGHVTAMHDPTEGGLANAIHELCDASGVGFRLFYERVPVHPVTRRICRLLGIDFMHLISSGCMLMTCDPNRVVRLRGALKRAGIATAEIGEIVADSQSRMIVKQGHPEPLPIPETDAIWDALRSLSLP